MAPESCVLRAWSLAAATVTGPTVGFNGMLDGSLSWRMISKGSNDAQHVDEAQKCDSRLVQAKIEEFGLVELVRYEHAKK